MTNDGDLTPADYMCPNVPSSWNLDWTSQVLTFEI